MQRLEVSSAVRRIYVVRQLGVNIVELTTLHVPLAIYGWCVCVCVCVSLSLSLRMCRYSPRGWEETTQTHLS